MEVPDVPLIVAQERAHRLALLVQRASTLLRDARPALETHADSWRRETQAWFTASDAELLLGGDE